MQTHDCEKQPEGRRQQISAAVEQTALLSMLALTDEEKRGLPRDFESMLAFADQLYACPAPTDDAAAPRRAPARPDVPTNGLTIEQVLANAPACEGRLIAVPRAVE